MLKAGILALSLCAAAAPARAQQLQWTDKGFVSVNVGGQVGSHDLASTQSVPLFDETASIKSTQSVGSGGLFDISAGYRVWHNIAVSIGYTHTGSKGDLDVNGSIPDPLIFDQPHPFTATLSGAKHSENVINIDAVYMMPVTDKIDLGFSLGPSIFSVKQDVGGHFSETNTVPSLERERKTTGGFNIGVDVTYLLGKMPSVGKKAYLGKNWGVGGIARYTWGSVKLPNSSDSLTVGGFQLGVGARVRF
jgi:hypothetical protein